MAPHPYLLYAVGIITLGTFQMGYNMAELNEPREAMSCLSSEYTALGKNIDSSLPPCIRMSPSEYGAVTSLFAVGGLFGALAAAPMSNKYGRRSSMALNTLGFVVGGIMKALAFNVPMLAMGRFISGLSSGAAAVIAPLYVNEIAPPDSKGRFGAFTQISINIGILTTQLLGLFLSKEQLWRLIMVVGAAVGAFQGVSLMWLPESPRYLVSVGNKEAARNSLAKLRGPQYDIEDEIREAEPLTGAEDSEKVTVKEFFTKKEHRKSVAVVCGLMLAQQMLGINAVIFHGVSVLNKLLPTAAGFINVIISLANLLFTILASLFYDRVSHKKLLILSMSGMSTFAFLLAIGMFKHVSVLSALACFCFVSSFSVGLGPLPWMVASKTVRFSAVDAAQSAGLGVNWIGTFIVAFGVPVVADAIGMEWVFVAFGFIGAFSALTAYRGVPSY